ncbi:MAG: hypothetical protein EOQ86_09130 [Mesorhizobium sp.]|nr:MAG: hypothetical protein EOQ85_07515 [Mesorhizobium sp.]RWH85133.1 MAG: hypothetical protein EOQ86_09130 [Mesorhizobium sp.]RWH89888.1 MAG: hypothetical protein EOQ87_15195 [Mesorhizobium sp.]RWI04630.1 MAG: hypothetical protein EOQ89_08575 [Mesorhizobium sp.]RWI20909.1 MAG: hypothetical protein EOQ91_12105 [Mesorhizobium sp.]
MHTRRCRTTPWRADHTTLNLDHWDDLLHLDDLGEVLGIKEGKPLAKALRKLGRIEKSLFMVEWCLSSTLLQRCQAGLNKGEAAHNSTVQSSPLVLRTPRPVVRKQALRASAPILSSARSSTGLRSISTAQSGNSNEREGTCRIRCVDLAR